MCLKLLLDAFVLGLCQFWVWVQEASAELQNLRTAAQAVVQRESDVVIQLRQEKEDLLLEVGALRERCRMAEAGEV